MIRFRLPLLVAGALLALALVTSAGGWLPALLGLHPGSEAQLGWDLAFTVLGGLAVGLIIWGVA